ncbi:MAG TPA: DUF2238 domain-containing protein [Cellvibrionaceae bacterium]
MPALIGAVVLLFTYKKFKLTPLLYILILIHCAILMLGGHFTYAEVPLPNLFGSLFSEGRNNFDKIGHFAQGFVPAIIAREILVRKNVVNIKKWLNFIVITICLSFSALYELIEWLVALLSGEGADAFLGTQGYVWDTQTDMFMALVGSVVAVLTLSKLHDKQLKNV